MKRVATWIDRHISRLVLGAILTGVAVSWSLQSIALSNQRQMIRAIDHNSQAIEDHRKWLRELHDKAPDLDLPPVPPPVKALDK